MNRNHKLVLNMQRFANVTQTTLLSGLSAENKTYYDLTLIDSAEPLLVHDQFATKKNIPANGGKTIEFRAFDSLAKATTPLTEGVTPDGNNLNVRTITATVNQYGDYVTLSDILDMTAIDNTVVEATKALGSQAGRTLDTITRDVLATGTNVIIVGERSTRAALTTADTLTPSYLVDAAAQLKAMNAPTIDGCYVAIAHPYVTADLMKSSDWIDVHKYADPEAIFNGEVGKLGNVRIIETSEAKIWADSTCPTNESATSGYNAVFSTLVLGAGAYATTNVEGGGLETIIKPLGAGNDPLNQRSTVGWKGTKTAEILVEQYMIRIESLSSKSAKVSAN